MTKRKVDCLCVSGLKKYLIKLPIEIILPGLQQGAVESAFLTQPRLKKAKHLCTLGKRQSPKHMEYYIIKSSSWLPVKKIREVLKKGTVRKLSTATGAFKKTESTKAFHPAYNNRLELPTCNCQRVIFFFAGARCLSACPPYSRTSRDSSSPAAGQRYQKTT